MKHLSHDIVSGGRVLERDPFQVREVSFQDRGKAVEFVQVAVFFREAQVESGTMQRGQGHHAVVLCGSPTMEMTSSHSRTISLKEDSLVLELLGAETILIVVVVGIAFSSIINRHTPRSLPYVLL